jgi:esterase
MPNPLLHYERQGQGPTLLVIHGLFGSLRNWRSLSRRYAEHFDVIAVDLRNHGQSFRDPRMDYPGMARDLLNLLDALDLPAAHLLGHSMGGKTAMMFAHLWPQRLHRLVVADIAPVTYTHSYAGLIEPVMKLDLSTISSRRDADERLKRDIPDDAIRLFLLQSLEHDDQGWRWQINWPAIRDHIEEITGFPAIDDWRIEHPCLFIRGGFSAYLRDEYWPLIERHFPNARLETIVRAGHWLHAEQPDAFFEKTLDLLN